MERRGGSSIVGSTGARIAQKMHERIDHVQKFARNCSTLFDKQKVDTSAPINCGSYGCVYPAGAGRVAKLSFDAGEAELAALFARNRGEHAAIPRIYFVGHAPDSCGVYPRAASSSGGRIKVAPQPLYIIVREDLADLVQFIELEAKNRLNLELMQMDEADYPGFGAKVDLAVEQLREYPRALRFYQQAVAFTVWALERELYLGDTHIDNWGVRDGRQIVLRDFGLASSERAPSYRSLPVLAGIGARGVLKGLGRMGLRIRGTRVRLARARTR